MRRLSWSSVSHAARRSSGVEKSRYGYLTARCDPYRDQIPEIPREVRLDAAAIYIEAFETIAGRAFAWPDPGVPIRERIRANLARYLEGRSDTI